MTSLTPNEVAHYREGAGHQLAMDLAGN